MKTFTVVCFLAFVAVALGGFTDRYDNINVDEIISNRRMLIPYLKCVLGQVKCSPEGKELKAHLKEALETNCGPCTEKQRVASRKVLAHLVKHEPDYWKQLVAKYDPTGKYTKKYERDLNAARSA